MKIQKLFFIEISKIKIKHPKHKYVSLGIDR